MFVTERTKRRGRLPLLILIEEGLPVEVVLGLVMVKVAHREVKGVAGDNGQSTLS